MQPESAPVFQLIKWNAVASWVSDQTSKHCDICKNELISICNNCVSMNDPSIPCDIVQGACMHTFHKHCLDKWFETKKNHKCLLCQQNWNPIKTQTINKMES